MEMIKKWPDLRPYLPMLQQRIAELPIDAVFTIDEIFRSEWSDIPDDKKKSIGKQFFDAVDGRYKFLGSVLPTAYPMVATQEYRKAGSSR